MYKVPGWPNLTSSLLFGCCLFLLVIMNFEVSLLVVNIFMANAFP